MFVSINNINKAIHSKSTLERVYNRVVLFMQRMAYWTNGHIITNDEFK